MSVFKRNRTAIELPVLKVTEENNGKETQKRQGDTGLRGSAISMKNIKITIRPESEGFHVTLSYGDDSQEGFLPGVPPNLNQTFRNWQGTYRGLNGVASHFTRLSSPTVTHHSRDDGHADENFRHESHYSVSIVEQLLNEWLNNTDRRWQEIRDALILTFGKVWKDAKLVPILLDTGNAELSKLPWPVWDLLKNREFQTELALRVREKFGNSIHPVIPQAKVQLLVLVGCTEGLDISQDLAIIKYLEQTQNAEITLLERPGKQDLQDALRDKSYHIFVYIGHSCSDSQGRIGWLKLNDADNISIADFTFAFSKAIDQGLQLAIFNSCDGLGLAHQLAELNLPRSIVMREPIPDRAAAAFLQHFLRAFSQDRPLLAALHEARSRLEYAQSDYPGIMWLPVLCTRESALNQPLIWNQMIKAQLPKTQLPKTIRLGLAATLVLGASGAATAVVSIFIGQPSRDAFADIESPQGTWLYGGSTTWATIRGEIDSQILQVHPDFNLVYKSHPTLPEGSGTGISMLLNEQLSFAQSSRPLEDEEYEKADLRGFSLKQVPVAIDAIAIAVHPDLAIDSLSIGQIQGIYTGRITNWQDIGGPDLQIIPYTRPMVAGGTPEFFVKNILGDDTFADTVQVVNDTTQGLRQVIQNPGGIYYASAPELIPQCKIKPLPIRQNTQVVTPYQGERVLPEDCPEQRNQINLEAIQNGDYPLTRRLFVIIKQEGRDELAGEAYATLLLTDEGQALMQKAGFIPLK